MLASHASTSRRAVSALALLATAIVILLTAHDRPAVPTAAAPGGDEPLVGGHVGSHVGGPAIAVAARGAHAYLGLGIAVVVLDTSEPGQPSVVGRLAPLPCTVTDVATQGDVLYVGYGAGFNAYDLAAPAAPRLVGGWRHSEACARGGAKTITLHGDYAYTTGQSWGTGASDKVFDIREPAAIRLVGEFEHGPKNDIAIGDGRLYAAENAFLDTYELTDPAQPTEVARVEMGIDDGHAYSVACADGHVFVGTGGGLLVNDSALGQEGRLQVGSVVWDVVVRAGLAYLAAGSGNGLWIVDVSDPRAPRRLASVPTGDARRVALVGDHAYVSSAGDGLWVVDVVDPAAPRARQALTTWRGARRLTGIAANPRPGPHHPCTITASAVISTKHAAWKASATRSSSARTRRSSAALLVLPVLTRRRRLGRP